MCTKEDSEVILDAYHKIATGILTSNKKKKAVSLKNDQALAKGMLAKICVALIYLDEMDSLPMTEIQKYTCSSKAMYVQYNQIKSRNPDAISSIFENRIEQLIKAVSRHEATMIENIRLQEPGGERIDIEEVFQEKKYYNRLGSTLAPIVLRDAIKEAATSVGTSDAKVYITETGLKYHVKDCPYCRRWNLIATTQLMAENQKLTPCKCIADEKAVQELDHNYVTAFIDESIFPVQFDSSGNKSNVGNFSYILCWGKLGSELEITDSNIIAKGLDYSCENKKIERLSEAAIGKVMISLVYDYNFSGNVQIYTDNMTAMKHWMTIQKNSKLAKHFESVTVNHINREFNKNANKICRKTVFLCMPKTAYDSVILKCVEYDELKKQLAEAKLREKQLLEQGANMKSDLTGESSIVCNVPRVESDSCKMGFIDKIKCKASRCFGAKSYRLISNE